ncbi:hypothetical protein ID1052_12990 [Helicobacter pylori]
MSYVKKIISLTFYMPLLLLLVLFNSFALQYAIKVGGSNEIVAKFGYCSNRNFTDIHSKSPRND